MVPEFWARFSLTNSASLATFSPINSAPLTAFILTISTPSAVLVATVVAALAASLVAFSNNDSQPPMITVSAIAIPPKITSLKKLTRPDEGGLPPFNAVAMVVAKLVTASLKCSSNDLPSTVIWDVAIPTIAKMSNIGDPVKNMTARPITTPRILKKWPQKLDFCWAAIWSSIFLISACACTSASCDIFTAASVVVWFILAILVWSLAVVTWNNIRAVK